MVAAPAYEDLTAYMRRVVDLAGSDLAVGKILGLADGSRPGMWRAGKGRPSELACMKLAQYTGDSIIKILRLAGYTEMADLLAKTPETPGAAEQKTDEMIEALYSVLTLVRSQRHKE